MCLAVPSSAEAFRGAEQPTVAPALRVTTLVEHGMVTSRLEPLSSDRAVVHLSYTLNHDQTLFFESGTLVFGSDPGSHENRNNPQPPTPGAEVPLHRTKGEE